MKTIYMIVAIAGALMTLVPPLLFFYGSMEQEQMKLIMFLGTMVWFAGAIPWLGKKRITG